MEQTAVNWLIEQLQKYEYHIDILDVAQVNGIFEQALEMERKQIEDAHDKGNEMGYHNGYDVGYNHSRNDIL